MDDNSYFQQNKELWNTKVDFHIDSDFYRMKEFRKGWNSLDKFSMDALGDIDNKKILHLQCHFGQDTMSMARLGAEATGLDFSDKAIDKGRGIAEELSIDVEFVLSSVYDMDKNINDQYDIVFTSYGCIIWLDDLNLWASLIKDKLKKGGKLVIVDFHPLLMMYNFENAVLQYDYFNRGVIEEMVLTSYTDSSDHVAKREYCWSHSISDLFSACLNSGFRVESFQEFDYAPYPIFTPKKSDHDRHFQFITMPSFPHCFSAVFRNE